MQFDTNHMLNSVGFLSPDIQPIILDLRKIHVIWFVFAEDVNRTGQRILREFQPSGTVTVRDVVGIALLMRSLSNFQGTVLMAERGMAVEAGTLARCCFENDVFLGTLTKEGDNFLAEMQMADRFSVKAMARPGTRSSGACAARCQTSVRGPDKPNQTADTGLRTGRVPGAGGSSWPR
jgi:hypothetical protein